MCIYIHEEIPHSPIWIYVYTHIDTAFSKVTSILILCGKLSSEQTFENCVPARIHRVIGAHLTEILKHQLYSLFT